MLYLSERPQRTGFSSVFLTRNPEIKTIVSVFGLEFHEIKKLS